MPCLSHDLSEVTRNLRKVTDLVSRASANNLTAADRTALRALLGELEGLVRTTDAIVSRPTSTKPSRSAPAD